MAETVERELLGKPKVEFTDHALARMAERNIRRSEVYDTVKNPSRVGLPVSGGSSEREHVRRVMGRQRTVDVVYELLEDRVRIITTWAMDNRPNRHQKRRR